ncbi:MAG: Leader peptidase (Prepilin peptidase) (EC / N-methyltransferase (EC [uncultured Sulfurovum sp.]|uniref:Leader peptidase (Prepilin peptidase) ) n=1 Tax=uncultured Sulfurovum sp. TaxID=269237 RepID=A0A6S6S5T5_9BACT|nr:MAG: Leader peptidase (Prepilin peptidase) (EC / N-methyltransferase (EC [uncultured Sulfurovum sp.]
MAPEFIIVFFIFIFGILIGSFLNVVIYRIPKGESIVFPASKCQSCQTPLKWYHNVPIFSWLFLKGKCGFCSEKISKQYPLIELATGIIAVSLFYKLGLVWYLPIVFAVFTLLLALVMIDVKYMEIPDNLNLLALALAVITPTFLDAMQDALLAVGGMTLLRYYLSFFLNKEAMGEGDIIVAGTMGALLGFPGFLYALFIAAIVALIPSLLAKDTQVPFVPFLIIGTFIAYMFNEQVQSIVTLIIYG